MPEPITVEHRSFVAGPGKSAGLLCRGVALRTLMAASLALMGAVHGEAVEPWGDPSLRADSAELAEGYVENFTRLHRLKAENGLLAQQLEHLDSIGRAGSPERGLIDGLGRVDPGTREALTRVLQENARPLVEDLQSASAGRIERLRQLRDAWLSVRTSVNEHRLVLFEVQGSRRVAGRLASLLSVDKRWFWLFGVVAVGGLLAVVFHDRRQEIRRRLSGGRARAMRLLKFLTAALVVLVLITLATFLAGQRIYESLLAMGAGQQPPPRWEIAAENRALEAQIETLRRDRLELQRRHEQAEQACGELLGESLPPGGSMARQWKEFHRRVLELATSSAVLESLPPAIRADRQQCEQLRRELDTQAEATADLLGLKRWIRGGLGLALVGLAGGGGLLFWRGLRQRRRTTADTCPLCMGVGMLQPVEDRPVDSPAGPGMVRCRNLISRQPPQQCDYLFMEAYRPMRKLCFPTFGVPGAGKTHWLAMLYWELNRGQFPESVTFEKIRSESSKRFDVFVEEILHSRIGTGPTPGGGIPHPLVFNFQDHDRLGRSNVLVNIFDYTGEMTSDLGIDDYRRRRALDADGFFFFLDPTFPFEPQAKALADFREDLRLVKGVKAGRRVRTPVALCVSKIDLLAGRSYALPESKTAGSDNAVEDFYRRLGQLDPSGESLSAEVLRARSRLTAGLREVVWPGWRIERQIDDLFGGRYMFFPLTPVGLDGRGETDLSLRTISPFGILEPLVWLLQITGHPVLEK